MKKEQRNIAEAWEAGNALPYSYLRTLNEVYLGRTAPSPLPSDLLEARFFDQNQEIRFFRLGNSLRAVHLTLAEGDTVQVLDYTIKNPKFGKQLTVTRLLDWDEDGQAQIAAVLLRGWKGGC